MLIANLLISVFIIHPAQATEVGLDLYQGSSSKSQALSASGDFGGGGSKKSKTETKETSFDWDLSYTRSVAEAAVSGTSYPDTSNDFVFDLGLETPQLFTASVGLQYSTTPEEGLRSVGPEMSLGYTYKFSKTEGDDSFRPRISLSISAASQNFEQNFAATKTRRNGNTKPITGENTIDQKNVGLRLRIKPLEWISLKAAYTKYTYNKDVNQFLQYLDNSKALAGIAGLNSAVSGFYKNSALVGLSFYFLEDWELALSHSASEIELDGSTTTMDKLLLGVDLNDAWHLGIGGENVTSNSTTGGSDHLGILSASYDF